MSMRVASILVLAACGGASTPVTSGSSNVSGTAATAPNEYDQASLVVRARKQVHGDLSRLEVERIYKGACDADLVLEPEAAGTARTAAGARRADADGAGAVDIYLLDRSATPDRWHLIGTKASEPDVIAALASVRAPDLASAWAADLATFRAAAGMPWSPAQEQAIAAGSRIFAGGSFIGMTSDRVTQALGEPDDRRAEPQGERWGYARHDGESGLLRSLVLEHGRVVAVDITRTE